MSAPAAARNRRPAKGALAREQQMLELGAAFRRVFRTLNRLKGRDTHLAGTELSHAQFELLLELDERGELAAGELAAAARMTPATVTQMLDHLASCGHVERARSETDRRVVVSRLTAQGRAQLKDKRAAWKSRWQGALSDLDEHELRAATEVLQRLGEMFEQGGSPGPCADAGEGAQAASQPR